MRRTPLSLTILMAAGFTVALLASTGERSYFRGDRLMKSGKPVEGFSEIMRAEAVWPFSFYTRESMAYMMMLASTYPPEVAIAVIDRSLRQDPYSPTLLWHKVFHELRRGNLDGALPPLLLLEEIGPAWPQTQNMRQVYEAIRAQAAKDQPE